MPSDAEDTRNKPTHIHTLISSPCFPVTLQFLDITYRIKVDTSRTRPSTGSALNRVIAQSSPVREERTILDGVTGHVSPGELLAVLGPSGSGKSTLLTILAGRHPGRHSGSVLANGARPTRPVLRRTGFVTQDDVLYPHLTVRETLAFCAMLRLPDSVTRAEKAAAAEAVIGELDLGRCADTAVGNGFVRGVSGGERKRVAVGMEMLINPSLLVLDEPTSGLDSTAAGRLVATLGGLARKGRSVVMSVHQPSSRVYQMFDSVMLLSEGSCVYFGKAGDAMDYFRDVGFVPRFHVNPADFMLDLANGVVQIEYNTDADKTTVKQTLVSSYNRELAPKVKACALDSVSTAGEAAAVGSQRSGNGRELERNYYSSVSWFSQLAILLHRGLKERRHETFNSLRVLQVVATALLAGSMWWRSDIRNVGDRCGLLFFTSIFWGVFASFNAVFAFPQERAIFIKERASGMYTLSSYFMARMAGDLPMELALPAVYMTILYWMSGLRPHAWSFALTLVVLLGYVLVAQGLGLMLGAAIMDAKKASTVVTITMLAFLLTAGFYVHNVPRWLAWMKYTSFTFYCYRLLIAIQYTRSEFYSYLAVSNSGHTSEADILRQVGVGTSVMALFAMLLGFRILAYLCLRRIKA
ncbi:putative ABC transporter G family member 25 [Iris pallida]|uniref:ABC transporter G family member 25 n=1 Tax=Iris pallida TaxID=29817 RepID=A0AAX6ETD5_IRIPA|nr:putative ABC transporter G family member 25 [Iris pallida]